MKKIFSYQIPLRTSALEMRNKARKSILNYHSGNLEFYATDFQLNYVGLILFSLSAGYRRLTVPKLNELYINLFF